MTGGRDTEVLGTEPTATTLRRRTSSPGWCRLASWLFAGEAVSETAATRGHVDAGPQAVWNLIMLYEEVPDRPPFLLRTLLPLPVRTAGDKTRVGATVRCAYAGGELVKRITAVQPPHCLRFEVIGQRLGIEGCTRTVGGSYQIHGSGDATEVVLTTHYEAFLHPRWLWRPLEKLVVSQLHGHILRGVTAAVELPGPDRS
jgi:Polyketide cyclase / dehydrase and lipid transport